MLAFGNLHKYTYEVLRLIVTLHAIIDYGYAMYSVMSFDLGTHSVGAAYVTYEDDGLNPNIRSTVVIKHDSGKDGMASGRTSSVSRLASGGIARRTRRLTKMRRTVNKRVENALLEFGCAVDSAREFALANTHAGWNARHRLQHEFIPDERERLTLFAVACMHLSRHRGWSNAWLSLATLKDSPSPTTEFTANRERFAAQVGCNAEDIVTQADLAHVALSLGVPVRQSTGKRVTERKNRGDEMLEAALLNARRVDAIHELRLICERQRFDTDTFDGFCEAIFSQKKPFIPAERVGLDWLPGFTDQSRAPKSSLEFQEYRIRGQVSNLSIRDDAGDARPLTLGEQHAVCDTLLSVTDHDGVTWAEIADSLGVDANQLVHNNPDDQLGTKAPVDRSTLAILKLKAKHPVRQWWKSAPHETKAELVRYVGDPAFDETELSNLDVIEHLLSSLSDQELAELQALDFESGRAAHSLAALLVLNREMSESGDREAVVKHRVFRVTDEDEPQEFSLEDAIEHPTIARVNSIVRKFIFACDRAFGPPDKVVIEHVRDALMGFNARNEVRKEQGQRRAHNERVREEVRQRTGEAQPRRATVRKVTALQRQGSACLYCGATIMFENAEMDHIVPRSTGGNSTQANLAAVCRQCNLEKANKPFPAFAEASGGRVSLNDACRRVDYWTPANMTAKQIKKFKASVKRRLKQKSHDDPVDERSLASTAYAATEMRRRIEGHYAAQWPDHSISCSVYSGQVNSIARKASGVDDQVKLVINAEGKSRLDRRHHAIDALIVGTLTPSVARTLAIRDDMRRTEFETGVSYKGSDRDWRAFMGDTFPGVQSFLQWKRQVNALVDEVAKDPDRIVVTQPVRFSGRHAALHEAGKHPFKRKSLGEEFNADELARIVYSPTYASLAGSVRPGDSLPSDPDRVITLPSGKSLASKDAVLLHHDSKARLRVDSTSSSPLGSSMHHSRILTYLDKRGILKLGMVRVWAADLYEICGTRSGDLYSTVLESHHSAVRRADLQIRRAIFDGTAKQIGFICPGDEVQIDPDQWLDEENQFGEFLRLRGETSWQVAGFEDTGRINLRSMRIASEGIDPNDQNAKLFGLACTGMRIPVQRLLTASETTVIRRTALGLPRMTAGGLPHSWCIAAEAIKATRELQK